MESDRTLGAVHKLGHLLVALGLGFVFSRVNVVVASEEAVGGDVLALAASR